MRYGLSLFIFAFVSCYAFDTFIEDTSFSDCKFRGSHYTGFSKKSVIKFSRGNFNDNEELLRETSIMSYLNAQKCVSAPKLYSIGLLTNRRVYFTQERIYENGKPRVEDLLLSLLEQKNLGVFQGDINKGNYIFDGEVCYLIDYGKAYIDGYIPTLTDQSFFTYLEKKIQKKEAFSLKNRIATLFRVNSIEELLLQESLDLSKTALFHEIDWNLPNIEDVSEILEGYEKEVLLIESKPGLISDAFYKSCRPFRLGAKRTRDYKQCLMYVHLFKREIAIDWLYSDRMRKYEYLIYAQTEMPSPNDFELQKAISFPQTNVYIFQNKKKRA